MSGGIKENAIPKSSQASILISVEHLSRAKQAAETFLSYIKTEYGATDPEIHLELTESTKTTESAITEASLLSVLTALTFIPCGVQAMSADIPDTVETSLNPGIMELTEKELTLRISIRSSVSSSKETLAEKISLLVKTLGGHTEFQETTLHGHMQRNLPFETAVLMFLKNCMEKPRFFRQFMQDWNVESFPAKSPVWTAFPSVRISLMYTHLTKNSIFLP